MKKLFFVALVTVALAACGGKKKDNTMKKDMGSGSGMMDGSGSAPAGDGSGSAAPAEGGAGG